MPVVSNDTRPHDLLVYDEQQRQILIAVLNKELFETRKNLADCDRVMAYQGKGLSGSFSKFMAKLADEKSLKIARIEDMLMQLKEEVK